MKDRIDRRGFLRIGAASLGGTLALGERARADGRGDRPNIILIMADDLGYGDLSCYGGWIRTPNIDLLSQGGMRFTDYHSNGPVCSPTRAALLTGRYQQRCGVEAVIYASGPARKTGMPPEAVTFAELLKECGYVTGLFGKWHLGYDVEFNPTRQGFDEFIGYVSGNVDYHTHVDQAGFDDWWKGDEKKPETGYTTDLITRHAVDFIHRHRDQPFCLYLPHEAPHYPYQGRNDPPERLSGGRKRRGVQESEIERAYREMVEVMDESVGRIVETLKRTDLDRRTFLFFCSDNGATARGSNSPLKGYKGSLWEGGHRVPAIAWRPRIIQPGTLCNETILSMDLFPTMLAIAGANRAAANKLDGVNLLPVLSKRERLTDRTVFWRYQNQHAVRKGPWKLLIQGDTVRLFNLAEDLGEQTDLALSRRDMVASLQSELLAWEREVSA